MESANAKRGLEDALEKVGRSLADKFGIRLVCRGERCATDGKTIFLPSLPDEMPEELFQAIRGYLDHETGHIACKSDLKLGGEFKRKHGPGAYFLFNCLEDLRVEEAMRQRFPGSGHNFAQAYGHAMDKFAKLSDPLPLLKQIGCAAYALGNGLPPPGFVGATARKAVEGIRDIVLRAAPCRDSRETVKLAEEAWERLRALLENGGGGSRDAHGNPVVKSGENGTGKSGKTRAEAAEGGQADSLPAAGGGEGGGATGENKPVDGAVNGATGTPPPDLGSQTDAGESGGQGSAESNAGKGGSASPAGPSADPASSRASSRTGDRNNASDGSADPDADDQIANGGTFTGDANLAMSPGNALAELDAEASSIMDDLGRMISDGVNSHAENAQVYRAWDKSHDRVATADNSSARSHHERLAELLPRVAGVRRHLLQALQAEPKARWRGDREEGKIDPRSLHRLACPAPERENRPRVFRKKVRTRRLRTAAALLVDESTSMLDLNRIELASQTALVFCEALARLNVKTGVIGFSTLRGDSAGEISRRSGVPIDELRRRYRLCPLIHTVYKRFDEKFSNVSGRFENMRPKDLTPLGESILFAARELQARPEERKVLFVLTDGMPFVGAHLAYAAFAHAREAVKRVEKAGVDVALVGIQEQAVRRLHHRSVVVNALDELPRTVMRQLRKLLAGCRDWPAM